MATFCRNPTKLLAFRNFSSTPFPSFRALKAAIQKESDPDKLFHIMESTSELPTFLRHRPLYHLSVRKLVRSNRPDLVERFLHHQKSLASTHPKSEGFWIRLIMLYSQAGLPDQSLRVFEDMQKSGLVPTEKSVAAVLTCLLDNKLYDRFHQVGDFESANKVLQTMVANGSVSPCSFTYFTLVRHMVEEGEFDAASEICREIIKRKWVPPFETMKSLVNGLVENSKVKEAKEIVEKMKRRLKGNAVDSWTKIEAFPLKPSIDVAKLLILVVPSAIGAGLPGSLLPKAPRLRRVVNLCKNNKTREH
ncbi:Pentatricopeptide repeat [Dillenia turbinata]|uniref:Pentatricopeptide repeat n=1 Tax=Dillenia turbinata TaxID=194707 RepID=A0AAN8VR12_9MAGN